LIALNCIEITDVVYQLSIVSEKGLFWGRYKKRGIVFWGERKKNAVYAMGISCRTCGPTYRACSPAHSRIPGPQDSRTIELLGCHRTREPVAVTHI